MNKLLNTDLKILLEEGEEIVNALNMKFLSSAFNDKKSIKELIWDFLSNDICGWYDSGLSFFHKYKRFQDYYKKFNDSYFLFRKNDHEKYVCSSAPEIQKSFTDKMSIFIEIYNSEFWECIKDTAAEVKLNDYKIIYDRGWWCIYRSDQIDIKILLREWFLKIILNVCFNPETGGREGVIIERDLHIKWIDISYKSMIRNISKRLDVPRDFARGVIKREGWKILISENLELKS